MAAQDDQKNPGSPVLPITTKPEDSPLKARSAFTQEQWRDRLTSANTPESNPSFSVASPNVSAKSVEVRAQEVYSQLSKEAFDKFHASVEHLDPQTDSRVTGPFLATYGRMPTKEEYINTLGSFGGMRRAQTEVYDAWIRNNPDEAIQLAPHNKEIRFALARKKDEVERTVRLTEQRKQEAEEVEKRRQKWSSAPIPPRSPKEQAAIPKPPTTGSKPQELTAQQENTPSGKAQRSPQFVGNVNVGAQKSKFNDFNARVVEFQQKSKIDKTQTPKPAPPVAESKIQLTPPGISKKKAALGMGLMGLGGVGKIVASGVKKGFEGSLQASPSSGDPSELTFLEPGYGRWRELLRAHSGLSKIRTYDQFKLWLDENPSIQGPTGALILLEDWKDHDSYEQYLEKKEEIMRRIKEKTQAQPPKKVSRHEEEPFYHSHLWGEEGEEEIAEETTPSSTSQKAGSQNASGRFSPTRQPTDPSPTQNTPKPSPRNRGGGFNPLGGLRVPGIGGIGGKARLVALIGPWGWAGIGAAILIIILIVIINPGNTDKNSAYTGEVTVTTDNTNVQNPGDTLGASTGPPEKKAVLGLLDGFGDILKGGVEKLKEYAQKYKDSLITYTITGSYNGPAREITLSYPIPEKAVFISASGVYKEEKGTDAKTGLPKTVRITWLFSENSGLAPSSTSSASTIERQGVPYAKYTQSPYFLPSPTGASDTNYSQTTINALNRLGEAVAQNSNYLQSKFPAQYVDPFLSVIWVGAIEGIGDQPYFWNCKDQSYDINTGCSGGYYSGGWQVGYGIQVAQVGGHLAADFDSIYGSGSSSDASKVQQVGQAVITGSGGKIKNPSTFPRETISSLVNKAGSGNQASQQAIAVLLMDQKLGATAIALEVAGDIKAQNNWAQTMRGWGSYYGNNMQSFSNRAKAIADKYTGAGGGGGNNSGTIFGTKSFTVTIFPIVKDEVVESGSAIMDVDEAPGSPNISGSSSTTDNDAVAGGHIAPSTNSCNGTYSLSSNPAGKNYGDPSCNYDKNKLYQLLKSLDPQNADFWFNKVIPCESAYNPNEFYRSGAAGDTPDPYGAWGLYQMGRGVDGPFTDLTKGSTNNPNRPEDRGDVNWELQTSNAVNFNKRYLVPNGLPLGAYWQCAR